MRKFLILAVIGISLLSVGFTGRLSAPVEGMYPLKLKTLTIFDLTNSKDLPIYGTQAELTDSKPDFLEVDGIDYDKVADYKFGSFRLGNNEKKVWFLMTKNSAGFWNNLYIDHNLEYKITAKDNIKSFQTSQGKESGYSVLRSDAIIPVPIKVSYKGVTKEYEKDLYFFISTIVRFKKDESHVVAVVFDASYLEGDMKVAIGKEQRLVKFRIIDSDSNGCFNDYGKDLLFINLKQDGLFHKGESQKLTEFFDSTGAETTKKQLRFYLLPFPAQMGVTQATSDFDLSQLEPVDNPVTNNNKNSEKTPTIQSDQPKPDQINSDNNSTSNSLTGKPQ